MSRLNEPPRAFTGKQGHAAPFALSPGQRLCMVLIGYIPFLNVLVIAGWSTLIICIGWPLVLLWAGLAWLLIVPPLVVRVTGLVWPQVDGVYPVGSPAFFRWWFTSQWQTIFNRLPMIEELLRLVPGLYSMWLRLWGARVGGLVYWTAGVRVYDRSWIDIGSRVSFGAGALISSHIIVPDESGRLVLKVGTVRVGSDTLVGAETALTCGSWIAPGQVTPVRKAFRPFCGWEDGKPVRRGGTESGHVADQAGEAVDE